MVGDKSRWYGLNTSTVLTETVPLVVGGISKLRRIERRKIQD
jgi:hypothetical protein